MSDHFQKGEKASTNPGSLFGILCVCGTIAFIAHLLFAQGAIPRRLWSPVVIDTSGQETVLGDTRQLEFWTPSVQTREYLAKGANGEIADSDRWQVISNEDAVLQFGMMLHTNKNVLGYRRVEVAGQGRTPFKAGWWWTLNVLTNYSAADLGQAYQAFWKPHQAVFIEVIDNRGSAE